MSKTHIKSKLENHFPVSSVWILKSNDETKKQEVISFLKSHGLEVSNKNNDNHLEVKGCTSIHSRLLEVDFHNYTEKEDEKKTFFGIGRSQKIKIPHPNVAHVIGTCNIPYFKPHLSLIEKKNNIKPRTSLLTTSVLSAYNVPSITEGDGTDQKVGIIELGGGFFESDNLACIASLPSEYAAYAPNVVAVGVDGAENGTDPNDEANFEVALDIQVIMAVSPGAELRVYFAPNSDSGFYNAIRQAGLDGCKTISISWGAPESAWSSITSAYNTLFQILGEEGTSVTAAAGDRGSSDGASGLNVDFPASSPYVTGCGGTLLTLDPTTEIVWNIDPTTSATGGGISTIFEQPSYQNGVAFLEGKQRGVPDLAGSASPANGYEIFVYNSLYNIGGTSAVAPLIVGIIAKTNQMVGRSIGFINPVIYSSPEIFTDITVGNNGAFSAREGWDACTGMGTPLGNLFISKFASSTPTVTTTVTPTVTPIPTPLPTITPTPETSNSDSFPTWAIALTVILGVLLIVLIVVMIVHFSAASTATTATVQSSLPVPASAK